MPAKACISPQGDFANAIQYEWQDARLLRQHLVDGGWKTPNTYDSHFCYPPGEPAVYLFLMHAFDHVDHLTDYKRAIVAYVGMSRRVDRRWRAHKILREIEDAGLYVQKWFRITGSEDLRAAEKDLIQKFNPPWNVQGRARGVIV